MIEGDPIPNKIDLAIQALTRAAEDFKQAQIDLKPGDVPRGMMFLYAVVLRDMEQGARRMIKELETWDGSTR